MRWGRKNREQDTATEEAAVDGTTTEEPTSDEAPVDADAPAAPGERAGGPWDVSEAPDSTRVELGSLHVPVRNGYAIQVPPEEGTTDRLAVLLVTEESVLELRAFASSRSGGLWEEVRADLAVEVERLGGEHTEAPGPFGIELRTGIPAELPDGQQGVQPGRILGVDGPRWFLRGTLLGLAAFDDDAAEPLLDAMRDVVVVRGEGPMMAREALPLTLGEDVTILDENGLEVEDDDAS